ncbi:MAG: hypothetical protein ACRD8W_16915 [Nitrososphaeraceae archaeon]
MNIHKRALISAAVSILLTAGINSAFASHGTDTASCENDGFYDGKNNPFSQELYEMCGDTYHNAFIEGCMSVEGNTEEICENVTDN